MKDRSTLVGAGFMLAVGALLLRLFYWQVINGPTLSKAANAQQTNRQTISAHRGRIFAKDGSVLAGTQATWRLFIYRPETELKDNEILEKIAPLLAEKYENQALSVASESARLKNILSQSESLWIPLKNKINREQKSAIEQLNIKGLGFDESETRMYPEASMSAHILGFLGKSDTGEDMGYFGLEGNYDLLLSGKSGVYESEANALGAPLVSEENITLHSFQGADLITSIDKRLQFAAESQLAKGLQKYEADAGTVTIMNPQTGEILAMASLPSYSPDKYYESGDDVFRNPVISDTFEPGSIMKPVVMAAGFDAKVITPESICDICSTAYGIDKYVIRTWDNRYYANSSMTDIIKHSDNVGMVYVGSKIGTGKLYDYLSKFGFGKPTGIDLQGEASAVLRKKEEWSEVDRATASFGQGIAVTPIQMVNAISVIANGGVRVTPHVVSGVSLGDWKNQKQYPIGERVISQVAAQQMTNIMVEAVKHGEAKWAVPKGWEFAGKTGTAQIAVEGQYDEKKTNASFIGFAPAQDPKFAMLVTLNQPKTSQWASETAAPLWFQIAVDVMRYMGIAPRE